MSLVIAFHFWNHVLYYKENKTSAYILVLCMQCWINFIINMKQSLFSPGLKQPKITQF